MKFDYLLLPDTKANKTNHHLKTKTHAHTTGIQIKGKDAKITESQKHFFSQIKRVERGALKALTRSVLHRNPSRSPTRQGQFLLEDSSYFVKALHTSI